MPKHTICRKHGAHPYSGLLRFRVRVFGAYCALYVVWALVSRNRALDATSEQPHVSYVTTMLDVTSMWAMGADARTIPPRRHFVPLVSWDGRAVARVRAEWLRLQWSTHCDRAMYTYPHSWGIASQMRDYSDAAFIALAFDRPLHVVKGAPKPRWCKEDAWLECFFEPLAGTTCERRGARLKSLTTFRPQALENGSALPSSLRKFSGPGVLHMSYDARFTFVLDEPKFFPRRLWDGMISDGLVHVRDRFDRLIDPKLLSVSNPHLYHTISVSALRTILTSVIFKPRPRILAESTRKRRQIGNKTCIALHLRWTDKQHDQGAAANLGQHVDHVPFALAHISERLAHLPSCIILLTDDDRRAVPMLVAKLGKRFEINRLSSISGFFDELTKGYDAYEKKGHAYFRKLAASSTHQERDMAYAYYRSAIVDAIVAARSAKALIGVGSSGLSQLVSQYMGFQGHADANAFVFWQEDIMNT